MNNSVHLLCNLSSDDGARFFVLPLSLPEEETGRDTDAGAVPLLVWILVEVSHGLSTHLAIVLAEHVLEELEEPAGAALAEYLEGIELALLVIVKQVVVIPEHSDVDRAAARVFIVRIIELLGS